MDFASEVRKQQAADKQKEFHSLIIEDIEKNLKPRIESDGTTSVSVFRSGIPSAPEERGVEKEAYEYGDHYAPKGRQGRMTGVFASPTLGAVSRWVSGNDSYKEVLDLQVREIRINPDETYVYSIRDWEKATWYEGEFTERHIALTQNYWNNGMTMTKWIEEVKENKGFDPSEWELLISAKSIRKVSNVSPLRVQKNSYNKYADLENILKKNRKVLKNSTS